MQAFVNKRALLLGRSGITLDPQEGVEVMRLKNPAIRREVLGKRKPFGSPSPNPTGPVQAANTTVWQPLETFRPLSSGHPDLSSEETVLGAVVSLAVAPKFDISNNEAFEQVCGEHPAPNTDLSDEARQAIEANWDELLANWAEDTTVRVIDPTRLS
jgi:hypothetical protein